MVRVYKYRKEKANIEKGILVLKSCHNCSRRSHFWFQFFFQHMEVRKRAQSTGSPAGALALWGGYSFVARLSHLTIEHASLSRRSTVPTPTRHLQHLDAPYVFSIRYIESFWSSYPLTVSPSVAIGHHLPPRIAIAFSLLSRVPNFSMSHSSISVIFPPNTSRSSLCISHSPPRLCEFYSLLLCLKGTSVNLLPPPLDY